MSNRKWILVATLSASFLGLTITSGCNPATSSRHDDSIDIHGSIATPPKGDSSLDSSIVKADGSEHGHKPGQHGGIMVSLGRDSYHIEAVVDAQGLIRLYPLGKDETRVIDVELQSLKGFVKSQSDNEAQSIAFEPEPQDGDATGRTSLFVAKLPSKLLGRKLDVTIPNIRIDGERFRLGFQTAQEVHGDSTEMPDKLADDVEKQLYMTPGGRYTEADIAANGNMTATQKFKGIKSAHDMNPKSGDRICPITETKANPKFSWIIDGKTYLFCCPPCVDEFVKLAKGSSEPVPDPDSFIKK